MNSSTGGSSRDYNTSCKHCKIFQWMRRKSSEITSIYFRELKFLGREKHSLEFRELFGFALLIKNWNSFLKW